LRYCEVDRLRSAFAFLTSEFGCLLQKSAMDPWDRKWAPTLFYLNSTTGVRVQYDVRDKYLSVMLYRLRNGRLPERGGHIDPHEGYSVSEIVDLMRTSASGLMHRAAEDWFPPGAPRDLDTQIQRQVAALRCEAEPVLRGDFGSWSDLRRMRERSV
jgi:hypothetical protein